MIRVPEVRLIGPTGENVGVVTTYEAMRIARDAEMDLVEVAPGATPACLSCYGFWQVPL